MDVTALLNDKKATPETILEVMSTSVAEVSQDKTEQQMRAELRAAIGEQEFSRISQELASKPELIREVSLAWIAVAGADPKSSDAVRGAIEDADRAAPLLETAALTVISIYALYLLATGGRKSEEKKIEYKPDGTFVETNKVVYASFSEPLNSVVKMFSGFAKGGG